MAKFASAKEWETAEGVRARLVAGAFGEEVKEVDQILSELDGVSVESVKKVVEELKAIKPVVVSVARQGQMGYAVSLARSSPTASDSLD